MSMSLTETAVASESRCSSTAVRTLSDLEELMAEAQPVILVGERASRPRHVNY
jgi:hypothetical protein